MQQTVPPASTAYPPPSQQRSARAPAIYCRLSGNAVEPLAFRLPCPPSWEDRPPTAWAAERRARRAYFAALDALRTGRPSGVERDKLQRFLAEVRHLGLRERLEHLWRVFECAIARGGSAPIADRPAVPFTRLELTVPAPRGTNRPEQLHERFGWTLEWLRTRGYVAGRDLRIDWRVQVRSAPRPPGATVTSRSRGRAST